MTKKLIAKTQELNPKLPQFSNSFSKCFLIVPETKELIIKKGSVYTVFEINGSSNFDTELIIKVIDDVLHDSYYQSDNISPIQSMEKAVSEIKQKIIQLSSDTLTSDPQKVNFNFISAILWGNVVYITKFGEMNLFIMKGGELSPMEMLSEGNFSSFSKIIKEDEVLIFNTKSFSEAFPTERFLSSSISENDMEPNQSCLLIKITPDSSDREEEVDLGLGNIEFKSKQRERLGKLSLVIRKFTRGVSVVFTNVVKLFKPLMDKTDYFLSKIIPKRKVILFTRKITQSEERLGKKTKGWVLLTLLAIVFSTAVFFTLKSFIFKENKRDETVIEKVEVEKPVEIVREDRSKDGEFKIIRVSPEVFYDLKIADEEADPSELQIVGSKLVVVDRSRGKIYHSDVNTPNFNTESNSYVGIKSLSQSDNLLTFNDGGSYKTYDIEKSELKESYEIESLNLTYTYSGYVYSISNDILTRSLVKEGKLSGTLWGQNPDFKDAVSMAIAYSVYILKEDGVLVEYSGGSRTDFSVSGLEKSFFNPVKVVADLELDNIYVADRGNKSIVVLNKDGELIKQYKNDDDNLWKDIRGISVTLDEEFIFILDSNKVFKLKTEE